MPSKKSGPQTAVNSVVLSNRKNPTVYIASEDDLDGPAAARALGISRRQLTRWCAEKPPRITFRPEGKNKVLFRRQVIEHYKRSREIRGQYHVEQAA